jgi:putative transposase
MDEHHLLAAARYVEMNPVATGLAIHPGDYDWSSARGHLTGQDDQLMRVAPLLSLVDNWNDFLTLSTEDELKTLRKHERSGRKDSWDSICNSFSPNSPPLFIGRRRKVSEEVGRSRKA